MGRYHNGYKLIWENSAPAPFESGWSIFAKLILLNGSHTNHIVSLISNPEPLPSGKTGLDFRHSDWIDFQRFSNALGIQQERLRLAFLDELGFANQSDEEQRFYYSRYDNGVKHCNACLAMGYHCVFFELGIVDTCPWHGNRLESACTDCVNAIIKKRILRKNKRYTWEQPIVDGDWDEWRSDCEHIEYSVGKTTRSIQFGLLEQKIIAKSCKQLLNWCQKVSKNSGIADALFHYSFTNELQYFSKIFDAAEDIAGPCPWPNQHRKNIVRYHHWSSNSSNDDEKSISEAARKTKWDNAYRSIRRHIFNCYVRQHRACWNELSNFRGGDSHYLDSDTVCPVALAYASWRMANEKFIRTDAFKLSSLRNRPIRIFKLDELGIAQSLNAFACFSYAQFFYIWEEILLYIGKREFAIQISDYPELDDFSIISLPSADCAEAWTVIIPDHRALARQSFIHCFGRPKQPGWMIYSDFENSWDSYNSYQNSISDGVIFDLKRKSISMEPHHYYMTIN